MRKLTGNTVLQRAPDIELILDSAGNARIRTDGAVINCGAYTLAVLDEFTWPKPLGSALENLKTRARGAQDWMDLTGTIVNLYRGEVLRDEAEAAPVLRNDGDGYDAAAVHITMLNDRARTSSFIAGVAETVRTGDIVVDIGTGTGVLAVAAARAGARRVYAIESSGIGKLAKAIFEANGLADRITLLEGWSTRLSLPERADVLISEMIGNEPLGENVLEVTGDAIKRHLKPGARLVPGRLRILGLPAGIPAFETSQYVFTGETLDKWRDWYGIEFGPLASAPGRSNQYFYVNPREAKHWRSICKPILLADIDLGSGTQLSIDSAVTAEAAASGVVNGILLYFEVDLSPSTRYSTHPDQVDESCHWRSQAWILADPFAVKPGDRFVVSYRYRMGPRPYDVNASLI